MHTGLRAPGVVVLTALLLGGCGTDRPTVAELSDALVEGRGEAILGPLADGLSHATADCYAEALHDSALTDGGLWRIVEDDDLDSLEEVDARNLPDALAATVECGEG